jgi:predicted nucleic acid-binding protein
VDALYVNLAEQIRAPLITTDSRLATSYPQAQVS